MIAIHANVSGTPTDTPVLIVDNGARADADLSVPGRASFRLPDGTPPWGATVRWARERARTVVPSAPGDYEGSLLSPPLPTLEYAPLVMGLHVVGDQFYQGAGRWLWRGCTDFRLPQRLMAGENIRPILEQRQAAGATLVRALAMKAPNTGWTLDPLRQSDYWGGVRRFFDVLGAAGLFCEWTVFADTRALMPDQNRQQAFWAETGELVRAYPFVLLELVNEAGHGTQAVDPRAFLRPSGVLASHGSGLTDAPPVHPVWDFATYHARRDPPPDTRGFTNYDPYAFEAEWPKPCPFIPDEGIKPPQYGFHADWAVQMGRHAAMGMGGTFHTDAGVDSRAWSPEEMVCAEAFYREL